MESVLPWYIAGPLLGLVIPLLLVLKEKQLGVSSSFRVFGSLLLPNLSYFKYDKSKDFWQVWFAIGIILSAVIFSQLGLIQDTSSRATDAYVLDNWLAFLLGGSLVGFGARYAGGCTAGHCLMGGSQLAVSSIITTISFFVGGLITSQFIVPLIF